jgi:hypothetical protein
MLKLYHNGKLNDLLLVFPAGLSKHSALIVGVGMLSNTPLPFNRLHKSNALFVLAL